MKTFKDLQFSSPKKEYDIERSKIHFPNGYGVSVIRGSGTYGYREGLYELAILYGGDITYNTGIAEDVIGHLDEDGVSDIMAQVQELL